MVSSPQPPGERGRILLVEDDAAVRRALQLLLSAQGYEVRAYPSGRGLAADPEALRSQCLVADLIMPDGDAIKLLRDMRHAGWAGRAVLISGHLTDEWSGRALDEGFDALLEKPLKDAALTACIGTLMPA